MFLLAKTIFTTVPNWWILPLSVGYYYGKQYGKYFVFLPYCLPVYLNCPLTLLKVGLGCCNCIA